SNAPLYGHVDTYVGRGIVGGRVFSFERAGKEAAELGLRILAGERPEGLAVPQGNENADVFDWRQLRRWGVREASLPPGSVVRFRETSFWDAYRWHILGVLSLCVVEALLIFVMYVENAHRRRADLALRESEGRFRVMADSAPVLAWTSGHDTRCTYFNKHWLEFTVRTLERQLGD